MFPALSPRCFLDQTSDWSVSSGLCFICSGATLRSVDFSPQSSTVTTTIAEILRDKIHISRSCSIWEELDLLKQEKNCSSEWTKNYLKLLKTEALIYWGVLPERSLPTFLRAFLEPPSHFSVLFWKNKKKIKATFELAVNFSFLSPLLNFTQIWSHHLTSSLRSQPTALDGGHGWEGAGR